MKVFARKIIKTQQLERISKMDMFYEANYKSELDLKNKVARALWNLVWLLLFYPSPRFLFGWRRFLLKVFGAKIANSARVYPSAKIWAPWNLEMKERTIMGEGVDCYSVDIVKIESDVTVSQYAFLCCASHDIESPNRKLITKPITLERGSWVFAGAFIGMGVTVHEGAIVAARSVVWKAVEPYAVVSGNPAVTLKQREAKWLTKKS